MKKGCKILVTQERVSDFQMEPTSQTTKPSRSFIHLHQPDMGVFLATAPLFFSPKFHGSAGLLSQ